MLKLKNIAMSSGVVSAEYDPEIAGDVGKIAIDVESGMVVEKQLANIDDGFPLYFNKALEWLRKAKRDNLPKEYILMWY